ncbi:hypothetical protein LENED_001988 [Lentinula edodes]|uniref:Uncharacterized protein n=1 Tax=Lentinula edodes TaxID=5353 RepID=A0A1Q3DZX6_LENED|nr:hypothetical protein LENED_001988 [Lentinula edodes]
MPRTRGKVNEIHARYISRSASGKQSNNHEKDSLLSPPGLGYRNVEIRESEVNSLPRTALSGLASGSPVWMAPRSEQTALDLEFSFLPWTSCSLTSKEPRIPSRFKFNLVSLSDAKRCPPHYAGDAYNMKRQRASTPRNPRPT